MNQQESTISGLVFRLDTDGKTLLAEFCPLDTWHPIDKAEIRRALAHQGLDSLVLDELALEELSKKYGVSTRSFTLAIGTLQDADAYVSVAEDLMAAYLTIIPPHGGQSVSRGQVQDALKQAGVIHGILTADIDAAIASGKADTLLIAQGQAATNGSDTEFRSLIPEIKDRSPRIDDRGTVDYRELDLFITVSVDDPLMERIPATAGTPGCNVRGEVLPANPGRNLSFAARLSGAKFSSTTPHLLVAAIAGQPILIPRGVKVEPTLKVKGIDLSTGNLEFDGSVMITGDVKSGMSIKVTGDVSIGGMVEAARIHAGGNITIRGGVIGQGKTMQETRSRQDAAYLTCGGSLSAQFIENAKIEAGDSILIAEVAQQSTLIAINRVIVGKEGSKKGHLVGGLLQATHLIQAHVAGSPTGVRTAMEIGLNPLLQQQMQRIDQQLQQLRKEQDELVKMMSYVQANPQRIGVEVLRKAEYTHEMLQLDIETCERDKQVLQTQMDISTRAKVSIGRNVFGGVSVRIGHKVWQMTEDRSGGTFSMRKGELFFEAS